jgi:hypothetical protein
MDEANQVEPPPSFVALFLSTDGSRLTRPAPEVIARYELCEDLAQTLSERAATLLATSSGSESEVIKRVRQGLDADRQAVTSTESDWVVQRLVELLGWRCGDVPRRRSIP